MGLRFLSARNTKVGTIHLFNGEPWACAKSLQKLVLDIIRPIPVSNSAPLIVYTDKEQAQIKEKLTALTSLVYLDLRGRALTFEMVEDLAFARLEMLILHVPYVTAEFTNRYALALHKALEWSKPRFPEEWSVHTSTTHSMGHLCAVIHASALRRLPPVDWDWPY